MGRHLSSLSCCWLLVLLCFSWDVLNLEPCWGGEGGSLLFANAQSPEDLSCKKDWGQVPEGRSPPLCKFVDELMQPPSIDISLGGVTTLGMYQIKHKAHRDLPSTDLFAYGESAESASYPGPTLEAKRWIKSRVNWLSFLTGPHMFTVDETLPHAHSEDDAIPVVPHLHGSEGEPASDGHAGAWFTANGQKGPTYVTNNYTYYNEQPPATLWYHDHAHGLTRLNVYSGLYGLYILRDPEGTEKYFDKFIPSGEYEVPLQFSDKIITANGSLYFPSVGATKVHPHWVPEFFGDVMLVNGKVWPYMNVKQHRYRFRMLNAANARFLSLLFNVTKLPHGYSDKEVPLVLKVTVISTDAGYIAYPVRTKKPLILAPSERLDIVVDFTKYPPGTEIIITNSARTPYPGGDEIMPDASVILKFIVQPTTIDKSSRLNKIPPILNVIPDLTKRHVPEFRQLSVKEFEDEATEEPVTALLGDKRYLDPATEVPETGSVEYWQIINLTDDAHPIHIHLAGFQIVSRRRFDNVGWLANTCTVPPLDGFTPTPNLYNASLPECWTGPGHPPEPYEMGWKDVVQAYPQEVTLLIVQFAPMGGGSYPFDPTAEPGYMWHCHILDHEDNEMMRPLKLRPADCK